MAGVAKKDEILEVASSSKSPKDLEAEISAAADAIGGAQTIAGTPVYEIESLEEVEASKPKKKPAKKTSKKTTKAAQKKKTTTKKVAAKKAATKKTTKKPEQKPQTTKKKPATKRGKVLVTSDVRPAPKKKAIVTQAKVTSPDTPTPSAVKVTVGPKKRVADKPEDAKPIVVLNRHGKDLTPVHATKKPQPKTAAKPVPVKTSVKVTTPNSSEKKDKLPLTTPRKKPYPVVHATTPNNAVVSAPKIATPPKKAPVPKPAHGKHTPHVARIYDTRTYHIPISVDHHHRKAQMPLWGQVIIGALAIGAMVAALLFGVIEF